MGRRSSGVARCHLGVVAGERSAGLARAGCAAAGAVRGREDARDYVPAVDGVAVVR